MSWNLYNKKQTSVSNATATFCYCGMNNNYLVYELCYIQQRHMPHLLCLLQPIA